MRSLWLVAMSFFVTLSTAAPSTATPASVNASNAVSVKLHPNGDDKNAGHGFASYYNANDAVIDFVRPDNQITSILINLPEPYKKEIDHLHGIFDNLNGNDFKGNTQVLNLQMSLRPLMHHSASSHTKPNFDKVLFERSGWHCVSQLGTTSAACQFLSGRSCSNLDAIFPGGSQAPNSTIPFTTSPNPFEVM